MWRRQQLLGLVVCVVGMIVWVGAFTGAFSSLFGSSTQTVKANFANVEDIVANDPVRINGVDIGTVSGVSAAGNTNAGQVTMDVDSQYHIYKNASANLVWRTVLGANDAIAIDPGTKDAGPLVGAIPVSRDTNQVELDQVILPFQGGAVSGLRSILSQTGPALSNHTDLAHDLNLYRGIAANADIGGGALRGVERDTDLRNLVQNAGQAAKALSVGTNASGTQQFVESAANTLEDLGGNPAALQSAIKSFSRVFVRGHEYIFSQYNGLLYKADRLVKTLRRPVTKIVPALNQFNPTLTNAHTLLTDATPLVHELSPAVDDVASAAQLGVPLITRLRPGLTTLAKTTLPGLAAKFPEEGGRTVYQLIGPTAIGLGVLTDFFNSDGEFANLTAGLLETNTQQVLPCTVDFANSSSPLDLLACQSLSGSIGDFLSGGSGLLSGLAAKPGGAAAYGSLLKYAQNVEAHQNTIQQAIAKISPNTAKFIFGTHGGTP